MARVSTTQKAKNTVVNAFNSAKRFVQPRVMVSPVPQSVVNRGKMFTTDYGANFKGNLARIKQEFGDPRSAGAYVKEFGNVVSGRTSILGNRPGAQAYVPKVVRPVMNVAGGLAQSVAKGPANVVSGAIGGRPKQVAAGAIRTGMTLAGGRAMTPLYGLVGGGLGAGAAALQKRSISQGFGEGIGEAINTRGLTRYTDPFTLGTSGVAKSLFQNKVAQQLAGRTLSGLGNTAEDYILSKLEGYSPKLRDHLLSFGFGALISSGGTKADWDKLINRSTRGLKDVDRGQVIKIIEDARGNLREAQTGKFSPKLDQKVTFSGGNEGRLPPSQRKLLRQQFIPSDARGIPAKSYLKQDIASGAAGSLAGFEKDEEGNWKYNPKKGLTGVVAGVGISRQLSGRKIKLGLGTEDISKNRPVQTTTEQYLQELKLNRNTAKQGARVGVRQRVSNVLSDFKEKIVDSSSPIEDAVTLAEKRGKFKVVPQQDVRLQIDRVLRSKTLASQFAEDNGMVDVIRQAPDLDELDQYMIAKQARDVESQGITSGRDLTRDQQLINDLSETYEPYAQQVNQYSRKLLDYAVNSGLISKELSQELVTKYPNYVPLQRVFNEMEQPNLPRGVGAKGVASLSNQSVVQKLKGSEREIESPIESLLLKTQDAFNQGERNQAGRMLAQMSKLPEFDGLIKELPDGSKATHTFSYIENGVKKTFETTPEIAAAAKNLNTETLGFLGKVVSASTRLLQMGATGLNAPFIIRNILKDQVTGFINSNKAAKTSLLNPSNFVRALFSAVKHDDLYKEVIRNAAGGTSFDIARQAPDLSVAQIRASRSAGSKIKYLVKNPKDLLRAVEDIFGRSEELGRIQNYSGAKQALLSEGRSGVDAELLAAQQARDNSTNFARKGSWGKVLNVLIPYFNAGIQGGRQLTRSFQNNPKATTFKVAATIFTPIAAATAWNLSDPERKKIYDDISDWEKDSSIIIIPPGATQNERGQWDIIKIPLPPGLSNLGALVRRPIEQAAGLDPVKLSEIATNIFTAGAGVDVTSGSKLLSSVVPQALKVPLELSLNKNLYTGKDIVPSYSLNKPPEEQVYPWTSGTARKIGGALNTSPLKIENAISSSVGGLGKQLLNASDTVLNKAGFIPNEQVGGESIPANINRSFTKAYGGETKREEDMLIKEASSQKKAAIDAYLRGDIATAKRYQEESGYRLTNKDIRERKQPYMKEAAEAYISGDIAKAKELNDNYKLGINNEYIKKTAKSQTISLYKRYKQTGNEQYLQEAKALKDKYNLVIKNSDISL